LQLKSILLYFKQVPQSHLGRARLSRTTSVIAGQYATSEIVKRFWSWAWLM